MAKYFHDEIGKDLGEPRVRVAGVKVWETDTSIATYRS
jgi:hypothetical protein